LALATVNTFAAGYRTSKEDSKEEIFLNFRAQLARARLIHTNKEAAIQVERVDMSS
jgi:hypothetical protein